MDSQQANGNFSRRDFLKFLGVNMGLTAFYLSGCSKLTSKISPSQSFDFKALAPSSLDQLSLPEGFDYEIIRSWKDPINSSENFGINNDYIAFFELEDKSKALLWVNHEETNNELIPDYEEQRKSVGGSVIAIEKRNGKWSFSNDQTLQEKYNCRYDANSPVTFSGPAASLLGSYKGTLANCSGGVTPWNTVLTCEENFIYFPEKYGWKDFEEKYYGWVVEIDPYQKHSTPVKHTALGRFAHENAAPVISKKQKLVVYMGDDTSNEHLYKYVSHGTYKGEKNASPLLEHGDLYVAKFDEDTKKGTWELLSVTDPKLGSIFSSQGELLLETRKAAKLLGATELNRPEDIEISPYDASVFVAQTRNPTKNDHYGSILRLKEKNNDHAALEFSYEYFLHGAKEASLACPDNLAFDDKGNLWVATDISGLDINNEIYKYHGNNALYMIPLKGTEAGQAKRFVIAPNGAELTGPCFSSDYKTLFLSVQHPGEGVHSTWPDGAKSSVVAIDLERKSQK